MSAFFLFPYWYWFDNNTHLIWCTWTDILLNCSYLIVVFDLESLALTCAAVRFSWNINEKVNPTGSNLLTANLYKSGTWRWNHDLYLHNFALPLVYENWKARVLYVFSSTNTTYVCYSSWTIATNVSLWFRHLQQIGIQTTSVHWRIFGVPDNEVYATIPDTLQTAVDHVNNLTGILDGYELRLRYGPKVVCNIYHFI